MKTRQKFKREFKAEAIKLVNVRGVAAGRAAHYQDVHELAGGSLQAKAWTDQDRAVFARKRQSSKCSGHAGKSHGHFARSRCDVQLRCETRRRSVW